MKANEAMPTAGYSGTPLAKKLGIQFVLRRTKQMNDIGLMGDRASHRNAGGQGLDQGLIILRRLHHTQTTSFLRKLRDVPHAEKRIEGDWNLQKRNFKTGASGL